MKYSEKVLSFLPNNYLKLFNKINQKIQSVDLIIEVVDARIVRSTFELFKYKKDINFIDIPRIVCLTFEDLANVDITQQWINFFKNENIYVILNTYFNNHTILDLLKTLNKEKYINNFDESKLFKIAITGVPKVGKRTLIKNFNVKNYATDEISKTKIKKRHQNYFFGPNIQIIDLPSIYGYRIFQNEDVLHNLAIFNKLKNSNISSITLATTALLQLIVVNPNYLKKYFGLNISKNQTKKELSIYAINLYFKQITINKNIHNEFNNIDFELTANYFLNKIRATKNNKISLEKPY